MRTHKHIHTPEHVRAQELTVIDHVMRTFIGHVMFPHACIAHSQWSRDAHTSTRARTHIHRSRDTHMQAHKHTRTHTYARTQAHAHASLTVNGHVTRTHIYARTQANAQEHELSQSSVIRCTQAHAHALPRACALNGPEAYFYYYSEPPPHVHLQFQENCVFYLLIARHNQSHF